MAGGENKARGEWEETDGGVRVEKRAFTSLKIAVKLISILSEQGVFASIGKIV